MLAANRRTAEAQLISSVSITPAHRAIGGTAGSVSPAENGQGPRGSGPSLHGKNILGLGKFGSADKPWGLERHAINLANNGVSQPDNLKDVKPPAVTASSLELPSLEGKSSCAEVKKEASKRNSDQEKNAAEFLKEVSSHLLGDDQPVCMCAC